tara:strand:- start:1133 stop:1330 length:198 start_codon:yes stop_codon:yes gene_type:complete
MTKDTDIDKVLEIHRKMIGKTVRVLDGNYSWIGKVTEVLDEQNFSVKRNKEADPKTVNMFDIRSL